MSNWVSPVLPILDLIFWTGGRVENEQFRKQTSHTFQKSINDRQQPWTKNEIFEIFAFYDSNI